MSVPTLDLSYLRLSYRPDLGMLFLRWTRAVTSAEHRDGYQQALLMAQPLGAAHWLIDLRTRGLASPEDFGWVLTDFRQQMLEQLPAPAWRVAYLVTPYQQEIIDSRLPKSETIFRTFIEEQAAYQWLGAPG